MDKACKEHQNFKIKYLVAGLLVCLLAAGVFGCGKGDVAQQNSQADLSSWTGTYVYGATFPHALEENGNYFIGYTVAVYEDNGAYYANVAANGWQICSESLARVEGDENRIEFLFVETLPKDSHYGKSERYEKDEVMLSFTRKEGRIQTGWGVLRNEHPIFIESEAVIEGDYFLKATDEVLVETNSSVGEMETSEHTSFTTSAVVGGPTLKPTPVPTPTPTSEPTPDSTPKPKGDFPERSYESIREFPYETMEFADESAYAFIKAAYDAFVFGDEFETGDLTLYDSYMERFRELVNCEVTFIVPKTGESTYINEYGDLKVSKDEAFAPENLTYHVFDVTGDNTPELCVRTEGWSTYIFKYDEVSDRITLLMEMNYYERFLGTGILYWNNFTLAGRDLNSVYHIDENGELTEGVSFNIEALKGSETYLVSIPEYIKEDKPIEITQELKSKAYYSEEDELYLFKVTAEQYEQLTAAYKDSWMRANREFEKVTYTYDELFSVKAGEVFSEGVTIERVDRSVLGKNGEKVGILSYDKIIFNNVISGADKINAFFEKDVKDWLDEEKNYDMELFAEQIELLVETYSEEFVAERPREYTVTTVATRLSSERVRVVQAINYWVGTNDFWYKVYIFDSQTGDLLFQDIVSGIYEAEVYNLINKEKSAEASLENTIEILFDTLYPDKANVKNLEVNTVEDDFGYQWQMEYTDGKLSDPYVLSLYRRTDDDLYHIYALYYQIWETHHSSTEDEFKMHMRNESLNYWLVNTKTMEVFPRWIYNPNAENDADTRVDNEEYLKILEGYSKECNVAWEGFIE